jgi:hypothetical protein
MFEILIPFLTSFLDFSTLAQASDLAGQIKEVIKLIQIISYLLAVGLCVVSAISFGSGRVEAAIYGVAAAGILALAPSIVKFAFEAAGGDFDL